jgi:phage terminase small subunit
MAKVEQELNEKQQIFAREYLVDRNATRAAIAAGYKEKTAAQAGSRLLKDVKIQAEIARRAEKIFQKLDVSAERVLHGLAELAFYDPRKMFRPDGSLKSILEMDDTSAMAIGAIDVQTTEQVEPTSEIKTNEAKPSEPGKRKTITCKVRMANRGENLERLGRYFKMFGNNDANPPSTVRVLIEHIGTRAAHPLPTQTK